MIAEGKPPPRIELARERLLICRLYLGLLRTITDDYGVEIASRVAATARTGVEMEALVAVSAAALTVYDMCKALDKGMEISDIVLLEKVGGKSGHYLRRKK